MYQLVFSDSLVEFNNSKCLKSELREFGFPTHIQSTSEIWSSLDFGQSTIVRFEIVWISNNVRNPNDFILILDVRFVNLAAFGLFGLLS